MPVRVNQRAVEARERKAAAAAAKAAAAEQEAERKRWEDNDKLVSRKLDRKSQPPTKLTRAQILQRQLKAAAMEKEALSPSDDASLPRLEPNINHIMRAESMQAQLEGRGIVSASTLDDALSQLVVSDGPGEDRHPERRLKAAYRAYEEQMMPRLKAENPTLKRSQLLELLSKQASQMNLGGEK
ncbi:hypothetical protein, conserved [Eimeria maxima]|uniref:Coiled-coil domain-containing protein n=1 Tax=Eimeria maxima TaxID=5804 RepID=U6M505_EIMMA|nr:hypothetical protein, conserved [Eimeria maxima]CDJ58143.1 hypothetical protein, conserved [Eimeria maxima]